MTRLQLVSNKPRGSAYYMPTLDEDAYKGNTVIVRARGLPAFKLYKVKPISAAQQARDNFESRWRK